jgi:hypothetical protein
LILRVYRFWREMENAIAALAVGILTDLFGAPWAIAAIGRVTFVSGIIVAVTMRERGLRLRS